MRRTAVIFMLIFTLLMACICSGCGAGNSSGGQAGSDSSLTAGDSKKTGDSAHDTSGKTGSSEKSGDASPDSSGKTGDASSIPDTNESAVTDWGTADAGTASGPEDKSQPSGSSDSSFSQVIVDNEDLYFAIKNVRTDAALGYTWKVYVENRTDRNLMFSFEKTSVNGVMCDPFWAEVVNSGKKGNCEITWMRDALQKRQIEEVTQVDFTLNVYNDDDYTEAPLMHDPFTVYPLGEDKASEAVREPAATDQVLVDNDSCSVIVTGFEPDNSWGFAMQLYLVNKTDKDLVFSADNASINGVMCDPFWADIVAAGKRSYTTVLWDKSALEENEIAEVEEISFPMIIYADDDIGSPIVEETFELTP